MPSTVLFVLLLALALSFDILLRLPDVVLGKVGIIRRWTNNVLWQNLFRFLIRYRREVPGFRLRPSDALAGQR